MSRESERDALLLRLTTWERRAWAHVPEAGAVRLLLAIAARRRLLLGLRP